MRRIWVAVASTALFLAAGCMGEATYENRLENTLKQMAFEQKLDDHLNPPEQGAFREKEVYFRAPKGLARNQATSLSVAQGAYDLAESFSEAQSGVPIQLHVLARWKEPPRTRTKKGEAPPPAAPRGGFEADVRGLLASAYGNPQAASLPTQTVQQNGRSYKRLIFKTPTENTVRAYFYEGPNHHVAIILDVPSAQANAAAANEAADLTLGSLSVGNAARSAFSGKSAGSSSAGGASF